jgi:hypothetical protein
MKLANGKKITVSLWEKASFRIDVMVRCRTKLSIYYRKFNSAPMCICSLCQKIIFLSVKKFKQKISHVHLHNPYAFVKVLRKNNIARGRCKKDKTCMIQCLLFSIKIYLFYVGQMISRFFVKRLCAHTTCQDVCVNFSFEFF